MSLATISDIHIHDKGDAGWKAFHSFAENPHVKAATHIALLGDIFDLMAGDHPEYLIRHSEVFKVVQAWCENGKTVFYAEGNHDMHLSALFRRLTKQWSAAAAARLVIMQRDRLIEVDGVQIQIGHGDRYNQEDTGYIKYMNFITANPLSYVANFVMPYGVLKFLGEKASKKSRKYGHSKFDQEKVRQTFRKGVEELTPKEARIVIGGHSHVTDEYQWDNRVYLNNGYPPASGKFVLVDATGAKLASLQ